MKIIIDGMGGDNAPDEIVKGALEALKVCENDVSIILVGIREHIEVELAKYSYDKYRVEVVNASEVISNEEAPVRAVRAKKDSSIVVGMNMVKEGKGELFISAGSTGAILAGSLFIMGRIQGIDRPTLATVYPILGETPSLMVDAGANSESKANNLLEFAVMASIYMEKVLGRSKPSVGLVNLGTEENKGTAMTKTAHGLLKKSHLNFVGNVEGRDVPMGKCDIIVCDGFVGNVILKLTEGLAMNIMQLLKTKFTANLKAKMGTLFLREQLMSLKSEFDYTEYGGAPILGVKKPVVKMHGSSNANAVKNTVLKAIPFVREGVVDIIQEAVIELEEIENHES